MTSLDQPVTIIVFAFTAMLNVSTVWYGVKYKLPVFPWAWALFFVFALMAGSSYGGKPEKFYLFCTMLSAVIVTYNLRAYQRVLHRFAVGLAIAVAAFLVLDALRVIPTPDIVVTDGELQFGGLIRRPYGLEHPNLIAAQMLLLPFGVWSVAVIVTQSRGAFLGLVTALIIRYVHGRWLIVAAVIGAVLIGLAIWVRPYTITDRLGILGEGVRCFLAHPLTGIGSGNFRTATTDGTIMYTAHNALITVAAENGLLGLVPLVGLLVSLFKQVSKSTHPARWGLLAFAIQQMVDDQWLHLDLVTSVMIGCALAVCLYFPAAEQK
jgi:hypothetical protein